MAAPNANHWSAMVRLLPLAAVLLMGSSARAESVEIKNDTDVTIVVSVSTVVGGKVIRHEPMRVAPGKACVFSVPGNRVVSICEAKFQRTLYSGTIPAETTNQVYSLQHDGAKVKLEKK